MTETEITTYRNLVMGVCNIAENCIPDGIDKSDGEAFVRRFMSLAILTAPEESRTRLIEECKKEYHFDPAAEKPDGVENGALKKELADLFKLLPPGGELDESEIRRRFNVACNHLKLKPAVGMGREEFRKLVRPVPNGGNPAGNGRTR